jgi:hypothetical protein
LFAAIDFWYIILLLFLIIGELSWKNRFFFGYLFEKSMKEVDDPNHTMVRWMISNWRYNADMRRGLSSGRVFQVYSLMAELHSVARTDREEEPQSRVESGQGRKHELDAGSGEKYILILLQFAECHGTIQ